MGVPAFHQQQPSPCHHENRLLLSRRHKFHISIIQSIVKDNAHRWKNQIPTQPANLRSCVSLSLLPVPVFIREKVKIIAISFLFQILLGDESQGGRIHTVPQAGRRRSIVEDMPEVGIAVLAPDLGSHREKAPVYFSTMLPGSRGRVKLGHPVPESYLSSELKSGSPETMST